MGAAITFKSFSLAVLIPTSSIAGAFLPAPQTEQDTWIQLYAEMSSHTANANANANGSGLPPPGLATRLLHADHPDPELNPNHPVAPALSLSTTWRYPHPDTQMARYIATNEDPLPFDPQDPEYKIYSRYWQDTNVRAEKVLSGLLNGHAVTYASGITAAYAAMVHYSPSVIAIRKGYHGVHESLALYARMRDVRVLDLDDEYPVIGNTVEAGPIRRGGLLVWVETPLNPTGEARDIEHYAKRAHAAGGYLAVDSTFAPPPLQDPFAQGTDLVMHSGTKYLGGHSDLLCGVLAVKDKAEWGLLWHDRTFIGAPPGNLEAYLLLRSLRTLPLRVSQQSATATKLAAWLHSLAKGGEGNVQDAEDAPLANFVGRVWHASLQPRQDPDQDPNAPVPEGEKFDPAKQMPGGWPATFAFRCTKPEYARMLPHVVQYFTPATSLGGVESLLEHRSVSSPGEDKRVVRVSVGLEDFEDLRADLRSAMRKVLQMETEGGLNGKK